MQFDNVVTNSANSVPMSSNTYKHIYGTTYRHQLQQDRVPVAVQEQFILQLIPLDAIPNLGFSALVPN